MRLRLVTRLATLTDLARSGRPVSLVALSDQFECSTRTLRRDAEAIRVALGVRLAWRQREDVR